MAHAQIVGGKVVALFSGPQPDAVDGNGNVVAGVPTVQIADDDQRIADFRNLPPVDISDVDNLDKVLKALGLCIAQVGSLTVAQLKALFKAKYQSLP